ncbi:MAG: NAD(P)-dependent oxidoreductase [Bacteroidales bacterium]
MDKSIDKKFCFLVTGGAGSVGLEVLQELHHRGGDYEVRVIDRNIPEVLKKLAPFRKEFRIFPGNIDNRNLLDECTSGVNAVIHLAAVIPPLADQQPELARKVNVEGTRKLIRSVEQNAPGALFLHASSISIYGDRVKDPWIRVDDPLLPSPGDEYAITKISAEKAVRESQLDWSVFRLTAILGPQTRMTPLFFHMPLDTSLEIATARDTGFAFVEAAGYRDQLAGRTFNLSGGDRCRTSYREFLQRVFTIMGLKRFDLPPKAFAEHNFHCGYYADAEDLNDILHFQRDTLEDYYRLLESRQSGIVRYLSSRLHRLIKKSLVRRSDPWEALRKGWQTEIERYYL